MATTSTTKQETSDRKKVKKKMSKAQMQLAIIKKKQCDAKALAIVEQLLEPIIDSDWLLCNLRFINKSHMEDVIEERAIIKLCGYVLCNKPLTAVIGQKYYISTRKNKVYDVTRRKNFCSSRCYGACNYLLEQMLTSPLWLRDKEEIPEFKVLPAKDELEKSIPGDEILVSDTNVLSKHDKKDESAKVSTKCEDSKNMTFNKSSESIVHVEANVVEESIIVNEGTEENNITKTSEIFTEQVLKSSNQESEHVKEESVKSKVITSNVKEYTNDDIVKEISTSEINIPLDHMTIQDTEEINNDTISLDEDTSQNKENSAQQNKDETIQKTRNTHYNKQDAITDRQDTTTGNIKHVQKAENNKCKKRKRKDDAAQEQQYEFYNLAVHIECNVREWITEDTICLLSGEETVKNRLLENVVQHDKYLHLCKKLNKLQLVDEKDDRTDLTKNTLKPLPHLSVLEEEGRKMELKVRAFYKGNMTVETPENVATNTEKNNDFAAVLPLTDAHAPRALRRRIFLDKLNRILPDLLRALATSRYSHYISSNERSALIKALVSTFSLSASNISFKTAEWTLVGLIIIKMLGMVDPQMKALLSTRQASMYISMILMSYKLDSNYLDRLVLELTSDTKICNVENTINL